jgi:hypothetical protein
MPNAIESFTSFNLDPINVYALSNYPNPIANLQFDFATPAGDEDTLINNLKTGDLVYSNAPGKIKKIKVATTNATLLGAQFGIVVGIQIEDLGQYYNEYDFTADGGIITILTGRGIEVFGDRLTLHSENTSSADTRIPFNFATHCASGAVLQNLIKVHGKVGARDVYSIA